MAVARTLLVFVAILAQPASSAHLRKPTERLAVLAVHTYKRDCGLTQPVSLFAAKAKTPGAGMSPNSINPYVKVLKDGFYEVDCVDDYMFTHGDKFGDHSDEYLIGGVSNVSIVHYAAHVAKEDSEQMTHEVCFSFCRTIPDMNFFGLNNGRECYCMTYYQAMEDDNSLCDEPCDGNPGTMCGGKSKSSIFGMHACHNTAEQLGTTESNMAELETEMMGLEATVSQVSKDMQAVAEEWQTKLGSAGDSGAAALMQTAKVFAGELEHAAGAASKIDATIASLKDDVTGLKSADLNVSAALTDAEKTIQEMTEASTQGAAAIEELESLQEQASPNITSQVNASQQYYPIMYFVNKSYDGVPSTCTGVPAKKPILCTFDMCAAACNEDVHNCVGFSYFRGTGALATTGLGLCFTMVKMKTVMYWAGCSGEAQLEEQGGGGAATCVVKFAQFEGDTLVPDPSGKCTVCLDEATKADRCYA